MLPRDTGWVSDKYLAMREIQEYVAGMDYDEFLDDARTQHAVIRLITIIGEATKNLSPEFRLNNPAIPWRELAGFRDMVVHNYHGVDLNVVWDAASVEFSEFLVVLEDLLPPEDG